MNDKLTELSDVMKRVWWNQVNDQKTAKYVDKTQAALIEDRLMHIISQFGYSRYT